MVRNKRLVSLSFLRANSFLQCKVLKKVTSKGESPLDCGDTDADDNL
jgi:hypothetical protein